MNIIEQSDFISLAKTLQEGKKFLEVANKLKTEGKFRFIPDRTSDETYLERYYYLNLRPFARIVIHRFCRSDRDGFHDHPWDFETYILSGGYWEDTPDGIFWRGPGFHGKRKATDFHRVQLDHEKAGEDTWTLFMMGPKEKEWGFLDKDGKWVKWDIYLNSKMKE